MALIADGDGGKSRVSWWAERRLALRLWTFTRRLALRLARRAAAVGL